MDSVDIDVLQQAAQWLDDGHAVRLATVVKTWGSSPRPSGSMAAIRADGHLAGSVSGGCVDDDLAERIRGGFAAHAPAITIYGVTREQTERFGLPCGGTLRLVVEPLNGAQWLDRVLEALAQRRIVARTLELATGKVNVTPALPQQTLAFNGKTLTTVHGPRWRLLIIGAGQLSHYLAQMAQALDYQVLICDPRKDYTAGWRVAGAEWLKGMPDDAVTAIVPDGHTVIVALTHDPKLDDMALLTALKSNAFYVGAIGSKANNDKRRARLALFDISPAEIARLHGPIGLDIGSRTPPEIAVSILAELTALRHARPAAQSEQEQSMTTSQ